MVDVDTPWMSGRWMTLSLLVRFLTKALISKRSKVMPALASAVK